MAKEKSTSTSVCDWICASCQTAAGGVTSVCSNVCAADGAATLLSCVFGLVFCHIRKQLQLPSCRFVSVCLYKVLFNLVSGFLFALCLFIYRSSFWIHRWYSNVNACFVFMFLIALISSSGFSIHFSTLMLGEMFGESDKEQKMHNFSNLTKVQNPLRYF